MDDDQKMKEMQAQIDALRAKTAENPGKVTDTSESMSLGMRAGTELVGTIIVAAAIGYGLDRWLGTKPWIMILMLIIGIIAAFFNVWKTTQNQGSSVGFQNNKNEPN